MLKLPDPHRSFYFVAGSAGVKGTTKLSSYSWGRFSFLGKEELFLSFPAYVCVCLVFVWDVSPLGLKPGEGKALCLSCPSLWASSSNSLPHGRPSEKCLLNK